MKVTAKRLQFLLDIAREEAIEYIEAIILSNGDIRLGEYGSGDVVYLDQYDSDGHDWATNVFTENNTIYIACQGQTKYVVPLRGTQGMLTVTDLVNIARACETIAMQNNKTARK